MKAILKRIKLELLEGAKKCGFGFKKLKPYLESV